MPRLEELLHFTIEAGPALPPIGDTQFLPVIAAALSGPGFEASLAAPGGDSLRFLPDGLVEPRVELMLRTTAGAAIAMRYQGIVAPPVANADPEWPIRMAVRFDVTEPALLWLARAIFVGAGRVLAHDDSGSRAEYRIYRLA